MLHGFLELGTLYARRCLPRAGTVALLGRPAFSCKHRNKDLIAYATDPSLVFRFGEKNRAAPGNSAPMVTYIRDESFPN